MKSLTQISFAALCVLLLLTTYYPTFTIAIYPSNFYIGMLLPLSILRDPYPSYSLSWAAIDIGIEDVAADGIFMPGVPISYDVRDAGSSAANVGLAVRAASYYVQGVAPNRVPRVQCIIGPIGSSTSIAASYVATGFYTPIVGTLVGASELSSKDVHPYYTRTYVTDEQQVDALMFFLPYFNWARIGFIPQNTDHGVSFGDKLWMAGRAAGIESVMLPIPDDDYGACYDALASMVEQAIRIIFFFDSGQHKLVPRCLEAAVDLNLFKKGYTIFASTQFTTDDYFDLYPLRANYTRQMMTGMIGLSIDMPSGPKWDNFASRFTAKTGQPATLMHALHYDAFYVMIRAFDAMYRANTTGVPIQQQLATAFPALVNAMNFTGITRQITFDPNNDRYGLYSLVNFNGTNWVKYGQWDSSNGNFDLVPSPPTLIWGGNTTRMPVDRDPPTTITLSSYDLEAVTGQDVYVLAGATGGTPPYVYYISPALPPGLTFSSSLGTITGSFLGKDTDHLSQYTIIGSNPAGNVSATVRIKYLNLVDYELGSYLLPVITVLAALTIVGLLAITGVVYYNRDKLIIKSSSPPFVYLSLVASILVTLCAIPFAVVPYSDVVCVLRMWGLPLSIVLMFTPLFIKTYRIKRIFVQRQVSVVRLTNNDLLIGISALLAIPLLLLISFYAAGQGSYYQITTSNSLGGQFIVNQCTSPTALDVTLFIYIGLLTLWGTLVAYQVRKVPAAFNEASHIFTCVTFFLIYGALVVPVQYIVEGDPSAVAQLRCFGIIVGILVCTCALYAPKLSIIFAGNGNDRTLTATVENNYTVEQSSAMANAVRPPPGIKTSNKSKDATGKGSSHVSEDDKLPAKAKTGNTSNRSQKKDPTPTHKNESNDKNGPVFSTRTASTNSNQASARRFSHAHTDLTVQSASSSAVPSHENVHVTPANQEEAALTTPSPNRTSSHSTASRLIPSQQVSDPIPGSLNTE